MATLKDNVNGTNALEGKLIERKYYDEAQTLYESLGGFDNTYFVLYEAYYAKLLYDYPINRYDLLLNGNMGYKGAQSVINYFESTPKGTRFVVYNFETKGQISSEITNFVKENYTLYKVVKDYYSIYVKI